MKHNTIPIVFKPHIDFAPPDCGGEEADEWEYRAHCPKCDYEFPDALDITKFCPNCGQEIYSRVIYPQFS